MSELQSPLLQHRELPHKILDNVWMWSVFSEEKGLYFNGYAIKTASEFVILDPPTSSEEIFTLLAELAVPTRVLLSNRDHEREATAFQARFQIPVACHKLDAPLLEREPEQTFADGDILYDEFRVIHFENQKSPGESGFLWEAPQILFLGDALIGKPAGSLALLPPDKYTDRALAEASLKARLLQPELTYNILLLGDGEPVYHNAKALIEEFFDAARN